MAAAGLLGPDLVVMQIKGEGVNNPTNSIIDVIYGWPQTQRAGNKEGNSVAAPVVWLGCLTDDNAAFRPSFLLYVWPLTWEDE